jgi:energy-coupling factor transport system ATP-binding protein
MNDIAALSDQVLVMEKGQVAMMGTPREVFSKGQDLKNMGLALPPAAEFMHRLAEKGFSAETGILTKEEALEALLHQIRDNREQVTL